jgi:hypothetical protein
MQAKTLNRRICSSHSEITWWRLWEGQKIQFEDMKKSGLN